MSPGFQRLLDTTGALSHPATLITLGAASIGVLAGLAAVPLVSRIAKDPEAAKDIRTRTLTWVVIAPLTLGPIIAGPLWAMLLVCALSLFCYREFARVTGLFRERLVSSIVVLGTLAVAFSHIDNWLGLDVGIQAVTLTALCVFSVLPDRPKGFIQRVALGAAAFLLFGVGLSRLGDMANDAEYRPLVCTIVLCAQLSDVFAYCCGKLSSRILLSTGDSPDSRTRLFPNTSPGKTLAGHLGALLLTTPLAMTMFWLTFKGTVLAQPLHLLAMGLLVSIGAQFGDLIMSSVKRDVGVKDMGALLPGHGGLLDRCNSLLMVSPAIYHYVVFFGGVGKDAPARIITAGWFAGVAGQ